MKDKYFIKILKQTKLTNFINISKFIEIKNEEILL